MADYDPDHLDEAEGMRILRETTGPDGDYELATDDQDDYQEELRAVEDASWLRFEKVLPNGLLQVYGSPYQHSPMLYTDFVFAKNSENGEIVIYREWSDETDKPCRQELCRLADRVDFENLITALIEAIGGRWTRSMTCPSLKL
jgi:hypothetical protein